MKIPYEPGAVPGHEECGARLAAQAVTVEYFARIDSGDIEGALGLYADDAQFLGARGKEAVREVMARGLAPNAGRRTRHVVTNVGARRTEGDMVLVQYTVLAYTLDTGDPLTPRTILDQEMYLKPVLDGKLRIVNHVIFGYDPPD